MWLKKHNYMGGGGHCTEKKNKFKIALGTSHINYWGQPLTKEQGDDRGTQHMKLCSHIHTGGKHCTKFQTLSVLENPYGRWVAGWPVLSGYNTTSWLHLASWNLPDFQLS